MSEVRYFFKRCIAKLVDYSAFILVIMLCIALSPWFFSDASLIVFLLLIPLLFVPCEAFFICNWATTPGKSLLGIAVIHESGRKLSYKEALRRSLFGALSLYTFLLPVAQLYFLKKEFQIFSQTKEMSWNSKTGAISKQRAVGFLPLALSFLSLSSLVAPYTVGHLQEYIVERHTPEFQNLQNLTLPSGSPLTWKDFSSPKSDFTIRFPDKPEFISKDIPIPNSEDALAYKEFCCSPEENITFSISYTTLPSSILKWSPSLVLKSALKLISNHISGASVEGKSLIKFKDIPGIDFTMSKGDKAISGTLLLIDTTLYKIEIEYEKGNEEAVARILPEFLGSFEPVKQDV